MEEEDEQLKKN